MNLGCDAKHSLTLLFLELTKKKKILILRLRRKSLSLSGDTALYLLYVEFFQ